MEQAAEVPSREITLVDVHGDFREFRGEMRAAMQATTKQMADLRTDVREGLGEIREAATNHHDTSIRVQALEDQEIADRITTLENNWRIAIWIGIAIAMATIGLLADAIRASFMGAG